MGGKTFAATAATAVAAILGLGAPAQAQPQSGQTVIDIPYTTCDGSRWTATWAGDSFYHQPEKGAGHADRRIDYRTWGGACWSATWDAASRRFHHTPKSGGPGHHDTILNFTDWDGAAWTTTRVGDGWRVTRR